LGWKKHVIGKRVVDAHHMTIIIEGMMDNRASLLEALLDIYLVYV
jgi:hypothetical protein